ncbi:threonine dehydrogenase-like Zn-dependent dehydrogenase [Geodermatophilus tzadiensis]|uniref:Threonine dehydrogenase-like Zn-dependent dehydrogenase n=1 Tax=Geodermatophilus tzadiensis TaxID=1137988 RepID=A0A2T0TZW6_9ACTN|nr:alcohol dehydrogenase catalytic domain-containing protein [Geodermatophilus tzadiensis]PRY51207.1 threonine dehydrogenase-like Zn-dependent dehydrogenase [Geodermatophilus tzadiensis]
MRAVTWHGRADVQVDTVPDPTLQEDTDVIVEITSSGICGSDLHLIEVMAPFMTKGDVMGHEPMGVVREVGSAVTAVKPGDRVVVPFNISCGTCWMCSQGLQSQCETTQNREQGFGASLFGYTKLYGQVPGGQAEYLRVPFGNTLPVKVPDGPSDDRFVYLSDVLPTSWQAVQYAATPPGGTLLVLGLGPIGDMCTRIASHLGLRVVASDVVPERLARASARGTEVIPSTDQDDVVGEIREKTDGRGADAVIDAVGMEAHGSPGAQLAQKATAILPDALMAQVMKVAGIDRLAAFNTAIEAVRRGGTVSLSGVYGGATDPVPLMRMFDKQVQLRMGQANVWRWVPDILPLLVEGDPLGVDDFATHRVPLEQAPQAYADFREKKDGAVKVLLQP